LKTNKAPAIILSEADWIAIERELCERSLEEFTKRAWSIIEPAEELIWNWHITVLCVYIEKYYKQVIKKLILNVPPGSMKSILFSVMGPCWAWAQWPHYRILNLTNEKGLAIRDSMRMKDIITSEWYTRLWGGKVILSEGKNEKTLYENTAKGFRQSLGMAGNISGKRGNFLNFDDPIDAKLAFSDIINTDVNFTFDQACSSRLNSMARDCIGLIAQRTRIDDLTGHVTSKKHTQWVHVKIPMEYEGIDSYDPVADLGKEYAYLRDPRKTKGELMFPARFPKESLLAWKEYLGEYGTASQLQQNPSPIGGGIIKKHYWTKWPKDKPLPVCFHVFASYDTAYTEQDYKAAAYTARTTWGVFHDELSGRPAMILIDTWKGRVAYPDLRKEVKEHFKQTHLDRVVVEKKASGYSLYQDLRRIRGISIRGYNPGKLDKTARAHNATPLMEAGLVYFPDRKWAEELIDIVATFPTGAPPCKDLTDSLSQAINYVRNKGWAQPDIDDPDHDIPVEKIDDDYESEDESIY